SLCTVLFVAGRNFRPGENEQKYQNTPNLKTSRRLPRRLPPPGSSSGVFLRQAPPPPAGSSPSGPSARLFPAVQVLVLAQFGRRRSQFGRLRPSLAAASALPIWSSPHRPGPLNHILAAALPSLFLAAPPPCCTPGRYSSPVH
uniref:Uncharacterized protein n=1 Tax=Aegilops tauschii subsp. strangulata TaxID=200361 RepID=A0A453KF06_AEGTS